MLDRTELDVRVSSHAAHVDRVNRLGNLFTPSMSDPRHASVRQYAASGLLHLANWLAPDEVRRSDAHESAAA